MWRRPTGRRRPTDTPQAASRLRESRAGSRAAPDAVEEASADAEGDFDDGRTNVSATLQVEGTGRLVRGGGDEVVLTPEGYARLQEEVRHLTTVRRPEAAARLSDALRVGGDLSDNSEYVDARTELELLESRIEVLGGRLHAARVLDPDEPSSQVVSIGSHVTLQDLDDGLQRSTCSSPRPSRIRPRAGSRPILRSAARSWVIGAATWWTRVPRTGSGTYASPASAPGRGASRTAEDRRRRARDAATTRAARVVAARPPSAGSAGLPARCG